MKYLRTKEPEMKKWYVLVHEKNASRSQLRGPKMSKGSSGQKE